MSNKTSDENVANIEENIKTIKNLLQMLENGFLTEEMCPIPSWDPTPKYAAALKYILAELEQKDKRIQKLEEESEILEFQNKQVENYAEELKKYNKTVSDRMVEYKKNSIPKQVVMDKIKENKQILDKTNDGNLRERLYIENGIMKELLQEEENDANKL